MMASSSRKPSSSATQLYELYRADHLVMHTMPLPSIPERPERINDPASLVCGSILFFHGLTHRPSGTKLNNAVARFGERTKIADTVFGTLHDLNGMWETHNKLEAAKPEDKRKQPFVFFTDCDMCDVANACGGQPGPDQSYMEANWQVTPPVQFQRPPGFDFRLHCESGHTKDDPRKRGLHCEWNELRAALNRDNMVGLAYIHDPCHDPLAHVAAAQDLHNRFDGQYLMAVFKLAGELQVHGHLVVEETCGAPDPDTAPPQAWTGRIVTFEEYIEALETRGSQADP